MTIENLTTIFKMLTKITLFLLLFLQNEMENKLFLLFSIFFVSFRPFTIDAMSIKDWNFAYALRKNFNLLGTKCQLSSKEFALFFQKLYSKLQLFCGYSFKFVKNQTLIR